MVNPLARVVMNNIKEKTSHTQDYKSERRVDNLSNREQDLVKGLINRDKNLSNHADKSTMITLDEAVERVKGGR
ncbi:MAG TPA: hypothetical protein VK087_08130 [Tissierellaceae bacterium]|nr:hypothetical protein [Tissierellaceae bacterium]